MSPIVRGVLLSLMAGALLSACAVRPGVQPNTDSKDLVTASDESDASKRARVRMELAAAYFGQGQNRPNSHGDVACQDSPLVDQIANGSGEHRVLERDFPLLLQHDGRESMRST